MPEGGTQSASEFIAVDGMIAAAVLELCAWGASSRIDAPGG
jgi:hypothetical protein